MARPFLATAPAGASLPGLRVAVEIAWGADLTDLDGSGWSWTDVTDDVILEGRNGAPIRTRIGRPDESEETQASELTMVLDNRTGKYSQGGQSSNWPNVKRGTPVRVRVSTNSGSSWSIRYQGQLVGLTPQWDAETGRWATVSLLASGPLRRLNQGTPPATSVFRRYMNANWQAENVVAYWPMEDAAGSPSYAQALGTTKLGPIRLVNAATTGQVFGQYSAWSQASNQLLAASAPLTALYQPTTSKYGSMLPPFPASPVCQVSGIFVPPPDAATGTTSSMLSYDLINLTDIWATLVPKDGWDYRLADAPGGSGFAQNVEYVNLAWGTGSGGRLTIYTHDTFSGATQSGVSGTVVNVATGLGVTPFRWRVGWVGSTYTVGILPVGSSTETVVTMNYSHTPANFFTRTCLNPVDFVDGSGGSFVGGGQAGAIGHIAYHSALTSLTPSANYLAGYPAEAPVDRMPRLGTQNGIWVDVLSASYTENASITSTVGSQHWDTLTNLFREAERTGAGVLYDGLGAGLTYISRKRRALNATSAALTIDAAAGQLMEPFEPVDDDQQIINDASASQLDGAAASYQDVTGPNGINAVGIFSTSVAVNAGDPTNLVAYAQWLVAQGTRLGYRYPTVSFALETNPSLITNWLACTPQSRIDVINLDQVRRQHAADPIWLLLEGWEEEIAAHTWRVVANTSPGEVWNTIRLAAATGSTGDDICHMDTDSSQLNTSAAAGATSISVRTNSGPLWVTSAADADSFPFWVTVGGLRVQVTAISGASSPQTFTLAAPGLPAAKTGSTTPGAGAPINVWRPPVLAL